MDIKYCDKKFLLSFIKNCLNELKANIKNNTYKKMLKPKGFSNCSYEKLLREYKDRQNFINNMSAWCFYKWTADLNESKQVNNKEFVNLYWKKREMLFNYKYDFGASAIGKKYSDEWCAHHQEKVLKNFDINMEYYKGLDKEEFNAEVKNFIDKFPQFVEIHDLNLVKKSSGYYLMILDEYKMVYIGKSRHIGERIIRHWQQDKQFDRLIFPMDNIHGSILSIDSFQPLDTTRIFVYTREEFEYYKDEQMFNRLEFDLVQAFSPKFRQNRTNGGVGMIAYSLPINEI